MSDAVEKNALLIIKRLREAGFKAYFAGGAVRDMIMGIKPEDYDIATDASPTNVELLFERVVPVGKQFGVSLV
ncbi:MAG: CCA tRNA nucleotidyltransferase, partial [Candidatus Latescibacteria bacterium]|nr:CCA tRNA nucleotidyltransferase [Candidatus Latescibacterota bacterium]